MGNADVDMGQNAGKTPEELAAMLLAASNLTDASNILALIVFELKAAPDIPDVSVTPGLVTEILSKALQPWYCLERPLLHLLARFEVQVSFTPSYR